MTSRNQLQIPPTPMQPDTTGAQLVSLLPSERVRLQLMLRSAQEKSEEKTTVNILFETPHYGKKLEEIAVKEQLEQIKLDMEAAAKQGLFGTVKVYSYIHPTNVKKLSDSGLRVRRIGEVASYRISWFPEEDQENAKRQKTTNE